MDQRAESSSHDSAAIGRKGDVVDPTHIPEDPLLFADPTIAPPASSKNAGSSLQRNLFGSSQGSGSSAAVLDEERTVISQRASEEAPAIPIGPLHDRRTLEGETLAHFRLEQYVGGGGMGAVYRAYDESLNRTVAVKILSRDQSDGETVRRFRNEAQSAARLDHPNIARVYFVGEDKGWNFIVFEYVEGTNLRELVQQRGPLPFQEALDYTYQTSEALRHAAARDVVHRDIKPSNVLVTADGFVKLVDMGLARLHQVESSSDDLTASGVTLGTFDYISPEQARDPRTADVRSDIYSLGCTLYFMIVGRPPFPEGTALQKLLRHNGDDPPDVRLFRPETPEAITSLLQRMLAKKREQRFQSPQELSSAIERLEFHGGKTHRHVGAPSGQSSSARAEHRGDRSGFDWFPWLFALAALVLIFFPWDGFAVRDDSAWKLPEEGRAASPGVEKSLPAPEEAESKAIRTSAKQESAATESIAIVSPAKVGSETKPPATTPIAKKSVIVGTASELSTTQTESAYVAETFAEALRLTRQHESIESIELRFDGPRTISAAVELPARKLTVRSAAGYRAELAFRPTSVLGESERRMIQVPAGGSLSLESVNVRWELPSSTADWALFRLYGSAACDLRDCAITIVNTRETAPLSSPVSVWETINLASVTKETNDAESETPAAHISVRRSIVRGEATLIRLPEDAPLRASFADSFVCVSERLLESFGLSQKPRWMDRMRLNFNHCTIAANTGIAAVGRIDSPFHMELRTEITNCVIVTEKNSPLLEFRGGEVGEEARFGFTGSDNCYPRSSIFYRRIADLDGNETSYDTALGDLPRWADDRNAERGSFVLSPTGMIHERHPSDYALSAPHDDAGVDRSALPHVDEKSQRVMLTPMNALPSSPMPPMSSTGPMKADVAPTPLTPETMKTMMKDSSP